VCLNNHKGLCGISDNFSRQTIWDQTKTFLIHEGIWVQKISVSPKPLIYPYIDINPLIIELFQGKFLFRVFSKNHKAARSQEIHSSLDFCENHKNRVFYAIYLPIRVEGMLTFESFRNRVICARTGCSARSQKKNFHVYRWSLVDSCEFLKVSMLEWFVQRQDALRDLR